ncbi:hypothetical protein [Paenibacillus alginolyticus]|uniref:hypothetical protein n=1 Tax=Paenibacillus alginolyticus TaxID=59839 RepID=UPI002DB9AE9B|nr:hypothetical protein [Paenibacillus alginolyticus]MEC0147976.1 hypothetical protein [Paenibacillus alginolyticus]
MAIRCRRIVYGYGNILNYFILARSPISAKMAEGSWDVWYNGKWTRSALKGYAGWIGSPMEIGHLMLLVQKLTLPIVRQSSLHQSCNTTFFARRT